MENPNGHRRSIRLKGYDYSDDGAYFLTLCVHQRRLLFGDVVSGMMRPNDAGRIVEQEWLRLSERFAGVELDQFVVMPNHVHGIIGLFGRGEPRVRPTPSAQSTEGEHKVRPYGTGADTIGRIVQAFKSITTNGYIDGVQRLGWPRFDQHVWQRDYYDHVIRNDRSLDLIREYIYTNPQRWEEDCENPAASGSDHVADFVRALDLADI